MGRGKVGTPSTLVMSPAKLRKVREAMRVEEAAWRAKCGPVIVRYEQNGATREEPIQRPGVA